MAYGKLVRVTRIRARNSTTTLSKPIGHEGSANLGFGSGIPYDNRHNVLNVRKGAFAELAVLHHNKSTALVRVTRTKLLI